MKKLTKQLLETHTDWYERLGGKFEEAFRKGDFDALSRALRHDPSNVDDEDDDNLSPEELRHNLGWTWENVREQFLEGRGLDDPEVTLDVAKWLGIDVSGLENERDLRVQLRELRNRLKW